MAALDMLVKSVFNMLDLDADEVKEAVMSRVKAAENNLQFVATSLGNIFGTQKRIEHKLDAIIAHHNIPVPPMKEVSNERPADNTGKSLPASQGPSKAA